MGTHSSILAWIIPWTKEPGRLHSMGSKRVRVSHPVSPGPSLLYSAPGTQPFLHFIHQAFTKNPNHNHQPPAEEQFGCHFPGAPLPRASGIAAWPPLDQ